MRAGPPRSAGAPLQACHRTRTGCAGPDRHPPLDAALERGDLAGPPDAPPPTGQGPATELAGRHRRTAPEVGTGVGSGMALRRRPADPTDEGFAREAHHAAYRDVVERQFGPWDGDQQDRYFAGAWTAHEHEIIELDGQPCGYVRIEFGPARVDVHELVIHPSRQGRGIGTTILRQTIERADQLGLPVHLQVLRENRAAELYERMGFREHDRTPTHRLMRRPG